MNKPVVMWFRRDLRLRDNLALKTAIDMGMPVIPVFIFDPGILRSDRIGTPRLSFMLAALHSLDAELRNYGSYLMIQHGNPVDILPRVIQQFDAAALYFNRDYTPFACQRDAAVEKAAPIPTHTFDDVVLHAPGSVMKKDSMPFVVFTPFKKHVLSLSRLPVSTIDLSRERFFQAEQPQNIPTLADLGFGSKTIPLPDASEKAAWHYLDSFMAGPIFVYSTTRNRLVAEPWHDERPGSSYLSPYLRFGLLSPRQVYWAAQRAYEKAEDKTTRQSVEVFISELIWREFYIHILYHFPHVMKSNFRSQYDALQWENDADKLQAWKDGMTGYPVVDAAMRQLRTIGWMPNRARMIVASFLIKDLLIDWRKGERHFMHYLIDGDPAANNGGWQWAAGTGTDAQPYFRIFNPVLQSQKFDSDGEYIRHWIPELRGIRGDHIHAPWTMEKPPGNYPSPIIDHRFARQRALNVYKLVKESVI